MNSRLRILLWTALAAMAAAVLALAIRAGGARRVPDLAAICALAQEGRFDPAQERMAEFLAANPDHPRGNLLMAQFALDRPDPQPDRALEHLRRLRPGTPREAAVVRFCMGKAERLRSRYDLAEERWVEALEADPTVPEAAWALMDLLDLEGRTEEARALGMWIHATEPDPMDRVRALLEAARVDTERVAPETIVPVFLPLHRERPEGLTMAIVAARALIRNSQFDEGTEILRDAARRHPGSARAWDAWLGGLQDSFRVDELVAEFARLPRDLAGDPRFARYEGEVAQAKGDWPAAERAYRRAYERERADRGLLNRLRTAVRVLGRAAEADDLDRRFKDGQAAQAEMRGAIAEARKVPSLGVAPQPDLYHRMADLRERVGRHDEALAWHRLVLRDAPADPASLAALERLKYHQPSAGKDPRRLPDLFRG